MSHIALLLTIFAVAGLVLAAVGVYSVMSYSVSSRRREMGIKLALGAHPRDLLKDVLESGLRLTLLGGAIGLAERGSSGTRSRSSSFRPPARWPNLRVVRDPSVLTAFLACCYGAAPTGRPDRGRSGGRPNAQSPPHRPSHPPPPSDPPPASQPESPLPNYRSLRHRRPGSQKGLPFAFSLSP